MRRRDRRRATTPCRSTSAASATCATAWCSPDERPRRRSASSTRCCSARSARPTCRPGVIERGLLLRLRFELDLYVNLRPFVAGPEPAQRRRRHARHPREHRGHVRGRGRVPAQGHAARGRDPGLGEHAHGRRALRPLRVRARAVARRASTSRSCTRPTCSRSPATSGSARSTRSRAEYPDVATAYNHVDAACIYFVQDPGRYDVIVTDNLFGDILTDLGGAVAGGIGRAASAQPQPGPHRPVAVRAGPRLGARHRRHRAGRSAGRDRLGRDDVGVPRRGRRGRASTQGASTSPTT